MLARHLWQLFKFGVVGASASATYFLLVVGIVESGLAKPLIANCIGYSLSIFVSYFGHQMWTFARPRSLLGQGPKFLAVTAIGFLINEGVFYLLNVRAHIDYRMSAILAILVVASITFFLNKFWVFRHEGSSEALD